MTSEQLKNSILQEAISGRLVPQDPNDEPASVLLERIVAEQNRTLPSKKKKSVALITEPEDITPVSGWAYFYIKDLFDTTSGGTPIKGHPEYYDGDIPWVRSGELNSLYLYDSELRITEAGLKNSSAKYFPVDTVVIAMYGATIGKTSIFKRSMTTNQAICGIFPIDGILPEYIYYFLQNKKRDYCSIAFGSGQPNISQEKIKNTIFPLPPLAEQKRIVAKLEELLPIVEQYGKAQKELDELNAALPARLRQSILQEAIQGKLTEHDLEDNWAKVYCEKLPKLKYKSSPEWPQEYPFELPENWEWCRIGDICELMNGYAFKSTQYKDTGVRVIRITNVQDGYIVDNNPKFYPQIPDIERYALKEGDLLMSLTGNVGRVGILPQSMLPAALNQRVACLRLKDERLKPFLFWYLRCPIFRERCEGSGHGMAQLNISTEWVKQEFFPLPPLAEQQRIVAKIEELFEQIDKISK